MSAKHPLKVVLCWHMHQPEYRDSNSGVHHLPWSYLHAIKDYSDMAAHLESVPGARAVVNFAPILLEQIDDYSQQIHRFLHDGSTILDPLLAALANPVSAHDPDTRLQQIKHCLRASRERIIERFEPYRKLAELADWVLQHPAGLIYLGDAFFTDLLVWYHLGWMGESLRRSDPRVKQLMDQASNYTLHDRRMLIELIGEVMTDLIPRYRKLAESGCAELAMSPYAHPIVPLLLDLESAREAMPDAVLPVMAHYPGGEARARWHIEKGLKTFKHYFKQTPVGCWPSEGGVSQTTLSLLAEYGFKWTASGGGVLQNSLNHQHQPHKHPSCIHHAGRVEGADINCYFRDDGLSDLIGFEYASWHADDAVANLLHHLDGISDKCEQPGNVVTIILDGENAWEYYPENGYHFLQALYAGLAAHPQIELSTFSDVLPKSDDQCIELPTLVAGSWVYGTFSTWIGSPDKNRGWDLLDAAKLTFDAVMGQKTLSPEQRTRAERQLAVCEGSDWCWWFGDYNPATSVSDFEHLYRMHLSTLYHLLGVEPPEELTREISHGHGDPAMGGAMRPGQAQKT
ncbi:MAG: glycoside hydrolase family 57 protein [Gammaproteobacteria bacterium]|nr:glycoside hydrolase family 57 protein [Gammaproteobacteria bacterium]